MYEHRRSRLLPWRGFLRRVGRHVLWAFVVLSTAVALGTAGYHTIGHLHWVDAFLNASMILSGMGPVDRMETDGGKIFSAFYALFSGLVFIGVVGLILAPWIHRLLHWTHLEDS